MDRQKEERALLALRRKSRDDPEMVREKQAIRDWFDLMDRLDRSQLENPEILPIRVDSH
jgi:hypothetical protein